MRRTICIVATVLISAGAASAASSPALWAGKAAAQLLAEADRQPAAPAMVQRDLLRGAALSRLQAAPLDPVALRWMATTASGAEKRNWLHLAETATRRDGLVQLELVEDAVRIEDPESALTHLDRAWTVYPQLLPPTAPLLLAALEDETIRHFLSERVGAGRPWVGALIQAALADDVNVEPLSRSIVSGGSLNAADRGYISPMLRALVAHSQVEAATAFAESQLPHGRETVRTADFTMPTTDLIGAPYTWTLTNGPEVATNVRDPSGLEVLAQPGISATIATRVMALPARDLAVRVEYKSSLSAANLPDGLSLKLDCISSAKVSRSVVLRAEPSAGERILDGRWNSQDCPLTALYLSLDTLRSSSTAGLIITGFAITADKTTQNQ